jgi:hypothetical protein
MADETITTETSPTETPAVETAVEEQTALGGAGEAVAEAAAESGEAAAETEAAEAAKPDVPEAYELAAPEGMTLNPADIEVATPVFKELGLNNEQANKLIPVAAAFAKRIGDDLNNQILTQVSAERKQWLDSSKADPEIGGANWDKTIATGAMALDKLGYTAGTPFRTLLNDSGLGNHPEMIRAFKRIGDAIGEDASFVRADNTGSVKKTDAELFYPNMKSA